MTLALNFAKVNKLFVGVFFNTYVHLPTNLPTYLPVYLPTNPLFLPSFFLFLLPFFFSSFLPNLLPQGKRFTSPPYPPPARDCILEPGLLGTYFWRCQCSHRVWKHFGDLLTPKSPGKTIRIRFKMHPKSIPKLNQKISWEITRNHETTIPKLSAETSKSIFRIGAVHF